MPRRATLAATLTLLLGAAVPSRLHAQEPAAPPLQWRPLEVGFGCDAAVSTEQPRDGEGSLKLTSYTLDPGAWLTFTRVIVSRRDGRPLGTLGQLAGGGTLSVDMFRHPDTGEGYPDYSLPLAGLHVRNAQGEDALLLWESPYNGFDMSEQVPEGVWLDDLPIAGGTFWMRCQGRNYNRSPGFQPLSEFVNGFTMVHEDKPTVKLGPDTQVMGVELGSGPNLPGRLIAYLDDVRISFEGGESYRYNFEPEEAE